MRVRRLASIRPVILALALWSGAAWAQPSCETLVAAARAQDDGLIDGSLRAALEQDLDVCARDAYFVVNLSRARAQAGLETATRLMLDQAVREQVIGEVEHQRELGWLDYHLGRHDEARRRGEALISRWPEWPDGYALVALAAGATEGYEAERAIWARLDAVHEDWLGGAAVRAQDEMPFWVTFAVAALAALGGLVLAAWGLKRRQLIGDLATSRIYAAAQGYVEIKGRARRAGAEPLASPRTRAACVWYRYTVYKRTRENNREVTRVEHRSESAAPFVLDDGSAQATVDPRGADVSAARRTVDYAGDRSHHEEFIQEGEEVHAIGWFESTHDGAHSAHRLGRPPDGRAFLVSSYREETSLWFARAAAGAGGGAFVLATLFLLFLAWHRFNVQAWPAIAA